MLFPSGDHAASVSIASSDVTRVSALRREIEDVDVEISVAGQRNREPAAVR